MRISLANGPSEEMPNLPMVNAMAPKAPIGARRIRIFTTPNTACVSALNRSTSGLQRGPASDNAKPNRIATSRT